MSEGDSNFEFGKIGDGDTGKKIVENGIGGDYINVKSSLDKINAAEVIKNDTNVKSSPDDTGGGEVIKNDIDVKSSPDDTGAEVIKNEITVESLPDTTNKTEILENETSNEEFYDEPENVISEEDESGESNESQKKDDVFSPKSLLESLDLEVPSCYEVEPVDFPNSPWLTINKDSQQNPLSDDEEDRSMFQAQLLSNCQDVRLIKDELLNIDGKRKKVIPVGNDIFTDTYCDESSFDGSHTSPDDAELDAYLDSPDELDDSIMERLGKEVEPIPELTAAEELLESRNWKSCVIAGVERRIDLKVLEPYKRVVSHGGYLSQGSHNAIIVFSACYLPDRSRVDYDYVMNNLFMYVITTLDQLVTDDYVLIYLHGATSRSCMPKFKWLKQCYQMIDRKLRKNLKGLYLVHPTFWLKTLVLMTKPFISSKFSRKLFFIYSLNELFKIIPVEQASIPDRVKRYDELKDSLEKGY